MELYDNIKTRREALGMTQTQLAAKIGYADKSMIEKIEQGMLDITQSEIVEFANALQTSPAELMGWKAGK